NVMSGVVSSLFTIVAIVWFNNGSDSAFQVVLDIAISTTLISYLWIFLAPLMLRYTHPHVERPYRVPFDTAGMWIGALLITAWVALGSWVAVFPGTLEKLFGVSYDFHDNWRVSRWRFEELTVGTLAVILMFAVIGYVAGAGVRRDVVAAELQGTEPTDLPLGAPESFNRRNANASLEEAVARVGAILARAERPPTVTISCSFGCPFEGEVDSGAVADLCERLAGADELVLADTIGVATPRRVRRLVERVSILGSDVGVHLHNTRNTGYACAWAALEGAASVLDASVGGLGGCPFSPQATGNIATEDLVWQLERDGVETRIDVAALV